MGEATGDDGVVDNEERVRGVDLHGVEESFGTLVVARGHGGLSEGDRLTCASHVTEADAVGVSWRDARHTRVAARGDGELVYAGIGRANNLETLAIGIEESMSAARASEVGAGVVGC